MAARALCFVLLLGTLSVAAAAVNVNSDLLNKKISRTIVLTTSVARHTTAVEVANKGSQPVNEVHIVVEDAAHLGFMSVSVGDVLLQTELAETDTRNGRSVDIYRVILAAPLEAGGSVSTRIKLVYTHVQTPFPKAVLQGEPQLVRYNTNVYVSSPYRTLSQDTKVLLASGNVKSHTTFAPTSASGSEIKYGGYVGVAPYAHHPLHLHFESNAPFLTVTQLTKEIEVSHWGSVAVEETYDVRHDGAAFRGSFSRLDLQRNPASVQFAIKSFKQILPITASEIYYCDSIGNITTSHIAHRPHGLSLELLPRYVLLGGWKAQFYLGYTLPLVECLTMSAADSSRHVLDVAFSAAFETDVVVDHLTVRVILPEGATGIAVHAPFAVREEARALRFSFLDSAGRPVVVLTKDNVVNEHNQHFQITYHVGSLSMLRQPLVLVLSFLAFLALCKLYLHLNLSINKLPEEEQEQRQRVVALLQRIRTSVEDASGSIDTLHASLASIKSKSAVTFNSDRKATDALLAKMRQDLGVALAELESLPGPRAFRLRDIMRAVERKRAALHDLHMLHESIRTASPDKAGARFSAQKALLEAAYLGLIDEPARLLSALDSDST